MTFCNYIVGWPEKSLKYALNGAIIAVFVLVPGSVRVILLAQMTAQERNEVENMKRDIDKHEAELSEMRVKNKEFTIKQDRVIEDLAANTKKLDEISLQNAQQSPMINLGSISSAFVALFLALMGVVKGLPQIRKFLDGA